MRKVTALSQLGYRYKYENEANLKRYVSEVKRIPA